MIEKTSTLFNFDKRHSLNPPYYKEHCLLNSLKHLLQAHIVHRLLIFQTTLRKLPIVCSVRKAKCYQRNNLVGNDFVVAAVVVVVAKYYK